jgi:hypothetical protein
MHFEVLSDIYLVTESDFFRNPCKAKVIFGGEFLKMFLVAFAKLRKAIISFVMSVCPSVSVRAEQLGSHWTDFR